MKNTDPRVDSYIDNALPFAKPILIHIRKQIHKSCPDISETIKWGFPHFEYHGVLCFMAAFKKHCTFGFWRSDLLKELREKVTTSGKKGMGQFGRITMLSDLPSDSVFSNWIREATKLNKHGIPEINKKKIAKKKMPKIPSYFINALDANKIASNNFKILTATQRNEYVEWITEAKTEATRTSRIKSMIEWVKEGKPRNWKFMSRYK